LIKANPCVYAGPAATDQCDILGRSVPVDATIRAMNVLFIRAFMPLFISFFLLLGLYMILMQGSPKGRAEAKAFFIDLTVGMILVGLSPVIYQITMNISSGLTEELWSLSGVSYGNIKEWWQGGPESRVYCCFFWIALVTAVCALIVAGFRYFMVMLFAALFPLSLFLYTFRFSKGIGNTLMKFSLLAIFTQVIMMAFFVIGLKAFTDPTFGVPAFRILFGIASMVAIMCTPLILLKVMHWIGGAVYAYSSRGGGKGIRALSQLMRGKDLGTALSTAAGRYETTHTLGMYERGGERMPTPGWSTVDVDEDGGGRYPGFPHPGVISWDPYIHGSAGRAGRLRTGLAVAGLAGGGGGRGAGILPRGAPVGLGASTSAVTPQATKRVRQPSRTAPSTGTGPAGGAGGEAGGGGAPAARVTAAEGGMSEGAPPVQEAPIAPAGGGGGLPPGVMPRLTQEQKVLQAYMQPDEVGDTQALLLGTPAPAKKKEGKPPTDISGRLAAIQKGTQERIAARRGDFEKYKFWALKAAESPELGGGAGEGESLHEVIPGRVHSPASQRQHVEPKEQKEITPPDWYERAKGEGFGNFHEAVQTLAQSGGQANYLLDQVDAAKGKEEHRDKTVDELLSSAKRGTLQGGGPKKT
jgi:hypothetical protein